MVIVEKDGLRLCTKTFITPVVDSIQVNTEEDISKGLNIERQNEDSDSWYVILSIEYDNKEVRGIIIDNSMFEDLSAEEYRILGKLYSAGIKLMEVIYE